MSLKNFCEELEKIETEIDNINKEIDNAVDFYALFVISTVFVLGFCMFCLLESVGVK